jgi:hypothetical protein
MGRLWTGDKWPLFLLLWFIFLALPRVKVIIIIGRTCGKALFFNLLLSDFCRPKMVDFLMIISFKERG